jgi:predicted RNase H-like HicB family nuclease
MANQVLLNYSVLLRWSEEDNAWVATVPEWLGLSALGKTRAVAVREIETVIKMAMDVFAEDKEQPPKPNVIPVPPPYL